MRDDEELVTVATTLVPFAAIAAALASSNASPVEFAESPAYTFAGSLIKVMGSDVLLRMAAVRHRRSGTADGWVDAGRVDPTGAGQ